MLRTDNFNGTRTRYGYDTADRLVSLVNEKSDGTVISSYAYTLDGNGNRTGIEQVEPLPAVLSSEADSFGYDAAKHRLTAVNGEALTYDDEGQLQTKGGESYAFDLQHRLKSVTGSASAQYSYDALGNRLQATRSGATTRYVYDVFGNLLAETDASNNITRYYVHGLGLLQMVEPSGNAYTYHFDGTANTVALTDAVQRRVKAYAYSPYGKIVNQSGTLSQPFTYVGQFGVMREPNGLYYMRARYYDPEVGRFISEDPIGFEGGQLNLYSYVGGNPIVRSDSNGLWYIDFNISIGYYLGVTFGIMLNNAGIWPYIGPSVSYPPGVGAATTVSLNEPTPGWNVGLQYGKFFGGQIGFDSYGDPFLELGPMIPGGAFSVFHVFDSIAPSKEEPVKP